MSVCHFPPRVMIRATLQYHVLLNCLPSFVQLLVERRRPPPLSPTPQSPGLTLWMKCCGLRCSFSGGFPSDGDFARTNGFGKNDAKTCILQLNSTKETIWSHKSLNFICALAPSRNPGFSGQISLAPVYPKAAISGRPCASQKKKLSCPCGKHSQCWDVFMRPNSGFSFQRSRGKVFITHPGGHEEWTSSHCNWSTFGECSELACFLMKVPEVKRSNPLFADLDCTFLTNHLTFVAMKD